jgi:hypothetical protein
LSSEKSHHLLNVSLSPVDRLSFPAPKRRSHRGGRRGSSTRNRACTLPRRCGRRPCSDNTVPHHCGL